MINIMKELKNVMIQRRRVDLAAGIVLAGAFRAAMTSLINDVILPPVSTFVAGTNLSNLSHVVKKPTGGMPPVVIGYGRFLQATIDFIIIGVTIIMILRATEKVAAKVTPKPTKQELLLKKQEKLLKDQGQVLVDIRDLLRDSRQSNDRPRIENQP